MKQGLLKGLSEEQIAKVKECKSEEELLKLVKDEGIELTEEQLAEVNGGFCNPDGNINFPNKCPKCGSTTQNLLFNMTLVELHGIHMIA